MAKQRAVLPVLQSPPGSRGARTGWWRAASLLLVHLLVAAHIWHYLSTGRTVSPLEPSESGQTLSSGVINAGAIFFVLMILSTALFGRFFCGWACHLVAYQDLSRWLLLKAGIRPPSPLRSRLLPLVPLFAVYWLFGRPLLALLQKGPPPPRWDLASSDFWATFPGPLMTAATVFFCGFLIVYVLGAKGFCTYACPYGVFFAAADRLAKARIRVTDDCTSCGVCTTVCSSNVQVAREVHLYGMVVDQGCMKCLDCVSHCPTNALFFGWRPARTKAAKRRPARTPRTYDLTWSEELFTAGVFAVAFAVYFNLHRSVPFLLAVGLSVTTAALALLAARLASAASCSLGRVALKTSGRLTGAGKAFTAATAALALFLSYAGWVQWHTHRGEGYFQLAGQAHDQGDEAMAARMAALASGELEPLARWWVLPTQGLGRMLGQLRVWQGRPEEAVAWLRREAAAGSRNPQVGLLLGDTLRSLGRRAEAHAAYRAALRHQWASPQRCLALVRGLDGPDQAEARLFVLRGVLDEHPGQPALVKSLCRASRDPHLPRDADVAAATRGVCPDATAARWPSPSGPPGRSDRIW